MLVSATMPTSLSDILKECIDVIYFYHKQNCVCNKLYSFFQVDSINKIKTDKLHAILPHVQQKFIRTNLGEKPSILLLLAKKLYKSNTPTIIFWYVLLSILHFIRKFKTIIYFELIETCMDYCHICGFLELSIFLTECWHFSFIAGFIYKALFLLTSYRLAVAC